MDTMTHAHRFAIDSHNVGTCRTCGETRIFPTLTYYERPRDREIYAGEPSAWVSTFTGERHTMRIEVL